MPIAMRNVSRVSSMVLSSLAATKASCGHSVALGVLISGNRLFTQVPGNGMRIKISALQKVLPELGKLHGMLLRYS